MAYIPNGYVCTNADHREYGKMEKEMMPFIRAKARRIRKYAGYEDVDDALQEGRLALLSAMVGHDETKGGMIQYVGRILDNTYKQMLFRMLSATKVPVVYERALDGSYVGRATRPTSMDALEEASELPPGCVSMPDEDLLRKQLKEQASVLKLRLLNTLRGKQKEVFECKTNPPVEFLKMVQNLGGDIYQPTNLHIAEYLGTTKNSIDHALYKIREKFTIMARRDEFHDLMGQTVESEKWPMIKMSKRAQHDIDFVRATIEALGLNPKPVAGYQNASDFKQSAGMYTRIIERYDWGVVLVLRRKTTWRTIVCVGKFNAIQGDVYAHASKAHERISVSWYGGMVKYLKAMEKKHGLDYFMEAKHG